MAANQVGLPCPPAAPGSVGQSCLAGCVLPGALLSRSTPQSEPVPVLVSCQRAGAGRAALLWSLPPAAQGLLPCVPASSGFGWWQLLGMYCSDPALWGGCSIAHTSCPEHQLWCDAVSCSLSPTSSPLLLTPVPALRCLSRGCLRLPPITPAVVLVSATVLSSCVSSASVSNLSGSKL